MLRPTFLAAALALGLAAPAAGGPPWIAVEYPSNPHHPSTRGALLLVRAYHHSTALDTPVRGTAEGIVDGKRRSIALDIRATNLPGVFAVRSKPPAGGTWVLALTLTQGEHATASALVTLADDGSVSSVDVPSTQNREGWVIPRALTRDDIERALRAAAVAQAPDRGRDLRYAGLLGLPLLLGFAALRRKRG